MLCVLVNTGFQVLFHSPPGVLFTFPSQYFCTIGHQVVFRLGAWSPRLLTGFHVSADTLDPAGLSMLRLRVSHTLWMAFPHHSARSLSPLRSPKPHSVSLRMVWPLPLSLATTYGITSFSLPPGT